MLLYEICMYDHIIFPLNLKRREILKAFERKETIAMNGFPTLANKLQGLRKQFSKLMKKNLETE